MKISLITGFLLTAAFAAYAQEGTPRMYTAEPANAQRGAVVSVTGDYIDASCVSKVFLTDGTNDIEVQVTAQAKTKLKFRVPEKIAAGKWTVMVLAVGINYKYIEEPVKVFIQD